METSNKSQNPSRNPWLSIWIRPKQTIRSIVDTDLKKCFLILAAIYGLPLAFNSIQSIGITPTVPFWAIIVGSLLLCPFLGVAGIYIVSWLFHRVGRWLGGKAEFLEVRAAVAWSNVPNIVTIVIWFLLLGLFGRQIFESEFVHGPVVGYQAGLLFLVMLVELIVSVWGFIILLNTLAEVQRFSLWRALFNIVIPFVGVIVLIWFIGSVLYGI